MKLRFLILIFFSPFAVAGTWGADLIDFNLEGGTKTDTMLWISGFAYSSTAFYQNCGALKKSEFIGSKYLIEILNSKYNGQMVTSEQATELISKTLKESYVCKNI